jgi:uncharacterized protein (DUF2236 family)
MQIAHSLVAQGVAEHSGYQRDRIGRLRTAAEGVNAIHHGVSGSGYSARDPNLLLWVLATLIDTSLLMHRRFVGGLSREDEEAYYADMLKVGQLLGLSPELPPAGLTAFEVYMAGMVNTLSVSAEARAIADDLFRTPLPLTPAALVARRLTAGMLPPALRDQYGLGWTRGEAQALDALSAGSRRLLPFAPSFVRKTPGFLLPPR